MSQINAQLTGVPRTLVVTLKTRVEEQALPNPLYQDPLAVEWFNLLPPDEELEPSYIKRFHRVNQASWSIRAYQYDQITSRFIANHPNCVVVELGSGLSTRFHRIGQNVERWIDLDLPMVTDVRRQLETETPQHQFVSASVMDFDWMNTVPDVSPENILFIAEGLLMYFEQSQIEQLVNQMRSRFPGATWAMDVMGNLVKTKYFANTYAHIGAPFTWFVKDEEELVKMGLQVVNSWSLYQLYPERWPGQWQLPLRFLSQFPYFRNAYVIVETKL